jgi:hypothetical protein
MRASGWLPVVAAVCSSACNRDRPVPEVSSLTPAHTAALVDSVRAFALAVARDVTREGPGAWRGHFAKSPAFFMAAEGRVVFPTSDAATRGIQELGQVIRHIELRWGDSVRVDPLAPGLAVLAAPYYEVRVDTAGKRVEETGYFTGLAEHAVDGWQLRDAHWSVVSPPLPTR